MGRMTHDTGGTTKSERTRAAILGAAREQFAARGYDRASVRSIAAQASIDPAMVIRYFSSKEALFAAAVDVDLMLPDLSSVPATELGARVTQDGKLSPFVNVYVNDRDVRYQQGLDTPVGPNDTVILLPAMAGG